MDMDTVAQHKHVNVYSTRKVNPCVRSFFTSFRSETSVRHAKKNNDTQQISSVSKVRGL